MIIQQIRELILREERAKVNKITFEEKMGMVEIKRKEWKEEDERETLITFHSSIKLPKGYEIVYLERDEQFHWKKDGVIDKLAYCTKWNALRAAKDDYKDNL